jgi:hypothetical protein
MTPKILIQRKFRSRWSDVQLLVMLQLAEDYLSAYAELVLATGASETGVWNALAAIETQDCLAKFEIEGRTFYHLSEKGRASIVGILS